MAEQLLPTTVVGSYPQPDWLVDRTCSRRACRACALRELWRVPEPFLEQAQDDATLLAIRDMERAGIDIITDGEMRRESYSNRFATALDGIDIDHPATSRQPRGPVTEVPRVVARIRRTRPVEVRDMEFLRRNTERRAKITLPGPFTMAQQVKNEYYRDDEEMAMDFAAAVNEEARDLQAAGADVDPARRAVGAQRPARPRKRYARQGDQPRAGRAYRSDRRPRVLRLCGGGEATKPTGYAFLPRARGFRRAADLDRGRPAEARPGRAEGPVGEEDHARRHRLG